MNALSNSLEGLATRIRKEQQAGDAAVTRGIYHFMAAGDMLNDAKKKVEHGDWVNWLAVYCEMGERTAQDNMKLARHRSLVEAEIQANPQRVADLSKNKALKLIASAKARPSTRTRGDVEVIPPGHRPEERELSEDELIDHGRKLLGLDPKPAADAAPDAPRGLFAKWGEQLTAALPAFTRKPAAELSPEDEEEIDPQSAFVQAIEECKKLDIGLDELIAIKSYGTVEDLIAVYESLPSEMPDESQQLARAKG